MKSERICSITVEMTECEAKKLMRDLRILGNAWRKLPEEERSKSFPLSVAILEEQIIKRTPDVLITSGGCIQINGTVLE